MDTVYKVTHRYLLDPQSDDCYVKSTMPLKEVLKVFLHLHQIGESLPDSYRCTESINPIELSLAAEKLFNITSCEKTDFDVEFDIYDELEGNRNLYKEHSVNSVPTYLFEKIEQHTEIIKDIYTSTRINRTYTS